jgi:hypothetical protein
VPGLYLSGTDAPPARLVDIADRGCIMTNTLRATVSLIVRVP